MNRNIHAILAAFAVSAFAWIASAHAGALDQFRNFATSTKSASGEFVQRVVRAGDSASAPGTARMSRESSGTFVFSRPGKFIWTYRKPYQQVLQADGEKLYIYDRDLNQVTVRKLGDALGSSPAAILFGNDLDSSFTLKEGASRDGIEWLQATPKSRDTSFDAIGIGMRDGVPVAMELRDAFGQMTLLTFTRFERNPQLSASQFRFVVPKGADVLEQ